MRVLFLNPLAQLGGAERSLLDLLEVLRPEHELGLITLEDGPLVAAASSIGITTTVATFPAAVHELGDSSLGQSSLASLWRAALGSAESYVALQKVRGAIRAFQPQIVHSNGIKTHFLSALTLPKDAQLVWHVRDFLSSRPLVRRALPFFSNKVSAIFAISAAVERDVRSVLSTVPVALVYNAVDLDRFHPRPCNPEKLDQRAGLPPAGSDTLRIGLVATYARWKGHLVFLEGAARARALTSRPLRFYIVGAPLYRSTSSQVSDEELRSVIQRLGLAGRVALLGFEKNPELLYGCFDVVVSPSVAPEPFGRSVVEAMASGVAVITGSDTGALELVEPNAVVQLDRITSDAVGRAVAGLAEDFRERQRLAQSASREALKFSRKRLLRRVTELYQSLA